MLEPGRKQELLKRATKLTTGLAAGEVTRAELRPVLNVLFLPAMPWNDRLSQARQLLGALPESWVARRSGKTRPQYGRVRMALKSVLDEALSEEELRFLLGWTARLVHVQELARKERERNSQHGD